MFTILKRFKKCITLMLCAAIFNACVMPSTALLAKNQPHVKKQPIKSTQSKIDEKETKKPTIQESWQKVINLELKSLTRDDAWNLGASTIGTLSACVLAYALFRSKSATADNRLDETPNIIPAIPLALQNITDAQYGLGCEEKIKDLCNVENLKQLRAQGHDGFRSELIQEIGNAKNIEDKKQIIDHYHKDLQEHLGNKIIIDTPIDTDTDKTEKSTKETKKPTVLYPHAKQAHRTDINVPLQKGLLCAIHALHDGNYINDMFTQDDSSINKLITNDKTLLDTINNSHLLSKLITQERIDTNDFNAFNENCKNWTNQTGCKRKADACEKYINHLLHACMTLTQEEQDAQAGIINTIKYFFTGKPLHRLTDKEKNSCALISSILKDSIPNGPNLILEWAADNINLTNLYNDIVQLAHQCNRNLTQQQQDDLYVFVHALDTAKLQAHFGQALLINEDFLAKAARHVYYNHLHLSSDFSGENLDSQELGNLIEQIGKNCQFKHNKGDLVIDFFDINNPETAAYNLNGKISIINDTANMIPDSPDGDTIAVIRHQMMLCEKFVHTFMIRLGNVKIGASTSTHWISATLVRLNNTNHYFMTDSIGANRINDRNILQLIDALEQPDIQEPIEILEQSENHNDILDTQATPTSDLTPQTPVIESTINNTTHSDKSELSLVDQAFLNSFDEPNKEIIIEDIEATHTNTQHEQFSSSHKVASIRTIAQKGNSCAYHALKNANDILHMLQKRAIQEMENNFDFEAIAKRISNGLCCDTSKARVVELFDEINTSGEWREIFKKNRRLGVLKESIYNKLLNCLANTNSVKSTIRNCLRNIAHACAHQLTSHNNPIDLTENVNLQDLFITMLRNNNPALLENNKEEDYNVCIALLNGDELGKQFGQAMTAKTALGNRNPRARELFGNDLDADELQHLIDNGNLENAQNISIVARIESSDFVAGNSHALSEVLPIVKTKMMEDNCAHAFLMRTGFVTVEDNRAQYGTHWICVVLYRVNGNNHWIIADSLNKSNRTNDVDVNFLIDQLEPKI